MIIIKTLLTLIGIFIVSKSIKYQKLHRTPLSYSLILIGIVIIFLTWFDEIAFLTNLDANENINYINLNFILIAILFVLFGVFFWIKNKAYINNIESEITKIVRQKAFENEAKK
jgi:ammonia channel protein AmtB